MDKWEKVIKGLEVCILDFISRRTCELTKCPYACIKDQGIQYYECRKTLLKDALELLKAQEPRVMTLDEVEACIGEPIYFESHGTYMGETGFWILPALFTATGLMRYVHPQSSHYSELGLHAYGKVWRCWTFRPTDEQRKAAAWE